MQASPWLWLQYVAWCSMCWEGRSEGRNVGVEQLFILPEGRSKRREPRHVVCKQCIQ